MEKNTKMKRKVLFKKFVPNEKHPNGRFVIEEEFSNPGTFHQFGLSMEEDESGFTNYTIAIIEDESGNLHEVIPSNMKFVDPEEEKVHILTIDFDGNLLTEIEISKNKIKVLKAMNGCGSAIDVSQIKIK